MAQQYRYFSADSHFECPPDMWTHRVPKAYRERAPRRVKLPNGNDIIVEEGRPITFRGTNHFAGKPLETFPRWNWISTTLSARGRRNNG